MYPDTDAEVREAAERLLRWAEKRVDDPVAQKNPAARALVKDIGKVAMRWLSEHPKEDSDGEV